MKKFDSSANDYLTLKSTPQSKEFARPPEASTMKKIALVAPSLTAGDAVGNDVLHMAYLFRGCGYEVSLFADHVGSLAAVCHPIARAKAFLGSDPSAIIVYHHSIDCEPGVKLMQGGPWRRVVRYHNVTPAHFFAGFNQACADDCRKGREQIGLLAHANCDAYLSDSPFNQQELLELGVPEHLCAVVPPFHLIDRLRDLEPDANVLDACDDDCTNLLFVGRLAPNKGHASLIDAFAVYHHHHDRNSRLLLIGKEDSRLAGYSQLLRERVRQRGVQGSVVFAPGPTDAVLKAYYASADLFVVASEHEGFCVPLVEAMALGLPITGFRSTAIGGTVGNAGLLWDERSDWLLAESIASLQRESPPYEELRHRGRNRYLATFTNERIEEKFWSALARFELVPPWHARPRSQLVGELQ
jgi:glycosyltransferase involved in cell wall biosynthesis